MKIQYVSQIFNVAQRLPFSALIKPAAPTLVLAGNCVQPWTDAGRQFMNNAARSFDKVFVVPGPAEYSAHQDVCYKQNITELYNIVYKNNNTYMLDNRSFDIDNEQKYSLAGTTLWNHLIAAPNRLNDLAGINARYQNHNKEFEFSQIQKRAVQEMHLEGREFLRSTVLNPENSLQKLAFATYHVPTFALLTAADKAHYDTAIMANNELFYCDEPLRVWIAGAGTGASAIHHGSIKIVKNSFGFSEEPAASFSKEAVVELS